MKNFCYILLLFTTVIFSSCNNDDTPAEKEIPFSISFDYSGEHFILDKATVGQILNEDEVEVGRFIYAFQSYPGNEAGHRLYLYFHAQGNDYVLNGIKIGIRSAPPANSQMAYSLDYYENIFFNTPDLPFTNNIVFENGKLTGEFGGELFDNGDDYISIENGEIDFTMPETLP